MAMTAAQKLDAYRFFAIAFDAAPGVTYMNQLDTAYNGGMTTQQIVNVYTTKAEFLAVYPVFFDNTQFATKLVETIVGTAATDANKAAAVADIVGAINAGSSRGDVIFTIFSNLAAKPADDAAWGATAKLLANQVAVAQYYTETLLGTATDLTTLRGVIGNVTPTTDVSTTAALAAAMTAGGVATGSTFTLTTGQDNIAGTGGNDTINGVFDGGATSNQNTLTAADIINGGAGKDSLMATLDVGSGGVLPAAQYSNIENFFIRNVSGVNPVNTFNFASITGEEQVWNDRSNNDVNVTGLAAGTVVGVKGNGAAVAGNTNATYAATATAASIVLDGGIVQTGSGSVTVNGSPAMTSATLTSSKGVNGINGLNLAASITSLTVDAQSNVATGAITGASLGAITVKGAGSANLSNAVGAAVPGNVRAINAADNTGGVTAVLNGQTNFKFTGGAGNDVVTTGAVLVATASVDAGAGTADRLVVSNTNHIRVDGTSKALGDLYKGFEQVQVQNGVNLNVANLSTNNTIDAVRINDTSGTTSVVGISATGAQNISILNAQGAITIGLAGATTTGQIDTVKAAVTTTTALGAPQNVNLQGINLAGVENLELTGSNGPLANLVGSVTLSTQNAIDLASIKLNNANAVDTNGVNDNLVTISANHRAINLNVDATGSGDTQINASAYNTVTGATLTTGAGNDVIIGSARADVINGSAGNDRLDGGDSVVPGAINPATADVVRYDFTAAPVVIGDTVNVTIGGQAYAATATAASPLNLANALANAIATGPANANIAGVTVVGNTVVVTGTATGAAANLTGTTAPITTDPAVAALTTVITPTTVSANATAASATLTFSTVGGSIAVGDVVSYSFTPATAPAAETVSYTVQLADVIPGDAVATASNVANKFAAAIATAQGGGVGVATDFVTVARVNNVLTLSSTVAGQTVTNSSVTVAAGVGNTAAGVTVNQVSEGTNATFDTDTIDFTGYAPATGDVVTVAFNDGAAVVASHTVTLGQTLAQVVTSLEAAIEIQTAGNGAGNSDSAVGLGNTIVLSHNTAGAANTITGITTTVNRAPLTSATITATRVEGVDASIAANVVTAAADRLTGGDGSDVFVINYSNVDAAGTDLVNQVTFSAMDTITDLNLGGSAAGTNVDTIDLAFAVGTLVNAGTPVAMAATAADLYDAVQALYNTGGVMDTAAAATAGLFTFNGNTYLIAEQAGNSVFDAADVIINVTGVTGTLSLTDLV